jgi:hypothetical protein
MAVEFKDFSAKIKDIVNDACTEWLYECSHEIASQAQRNTTPGTDYYSELRDSYRPEVNEGQAEAKIGSPLEQAYWEEWGTGEHAVADPHRTGWWVYVKGQESTPGGGKHYKTKADAERAASFLRRLKKLDAYATNGRDPNYTLENAFKVTAPKQEPKLQQKLNERLGK